MPEHSGPGPAPKTPLPGVRRVVAVGAGKGGVGKSTVAVNLALSLKALGGAVGLMDGDVYGPSIPIMLGTSARLQGSGPHAIRPNQAHGLSVVSMGFLLDPEKPMVVRGPIVHTVIRQFLSDVQWGDLDWLIVDLPPGTGDVALSLAQSVPLTGAVVVSTPQDVALADVAKASAMFRTLKVPLLGLVENMSGWVCPSCGHEENLFGRGGAEAWAEREKIPWLGRIPLERSISVGGDGGRPAFVDSATSPALRRAFEDVGTRLIQVVEQLEAESPPGPLVQIRKHGGR